METQRVLCFSLLLKGAVLGETLFELGGMRKWPDDSVKWITISEGFGRRRVIQA